MKSTLIINDLHIGARRTGGTTPQTAIRLREELLANIRALMMAHCDKHIIINGDLFDAFDIAMGDALAFYEIAVDWLQAADSNAKLVIGQGNHDISKDSSRLSMFAFVCTILADVFKSDTQYGPRVTIVTEPMKLLWDAFYMIPHAINQEEFNAQLKAAEGLPPTLVLLHANFDNGFATEQDHSLNVSRDQAKRLVDKGHTLIFGHEHQEKIDMNDRVIVVGNQFPTSVMDCLGNDRKKALIISPNGDIEEHETWCAEQKFLRIDWREAKELMSANDWYKVADRWEFIRIEGSCSATEASDMISVVSKLRQHSDAFVVSNAVKVEGIGDMQELQIAAEDMASSDVLAYLYEHLEPAEIQVVEKLLAERSE